MGPTVKIYWWQKLLIVESNNILLIQFRDEISCFVCCVSVILISFGFGNPSAVPEICFGMRSANTKWNKSSLSPGPTLFSSFHLFCQSVVKHNLLRCISANRRQFVFCNVSLSQVLNWPLPNFVQDVAIEPSSWLTCKIFKFHQAETHTTIKWMSCNVVKCAGKCRRGQWQPNHCELGQWKFWWQKRKCEDGFKETVQIGALKEICCQDVTTFGSFLRRNSAARNACQTCFLVEENLELHNTVPSAVVSNSSRPFPFVPLCHEMEKLFLLLQENSLLCPTY